jgi:hypothetical protein
VTTEYFENVCLGDYDGEAPLQHARKAARSEKSVP